MFAFDAKPAWDISVRGVFLFVARDEARENGPRVQAASVKWCPYFLFDIAIGRVKAFRVLSGLFIKVPVG